MRTHVGDIGFNDDVWNNVSVPMTGVQGQGLNKPTWSQITDDGAGSTGIYAWSFDPTAEEELFFTVQAPFSYKEGTNVHPHVHWMPTTTNVGNVVWAMELAPIRENGLMGNSTIITNTVASGGVADKMLISDFDELDGSNFDFNTTIICRIFRDATNAADTYTGEAILLLVDFNHLMDTIGSDSLHSKTPGNTR